MQVIILEGEGEHKDYYVFHKGEWVMVYCDIQTGGRTEYGTECERPNSFPANNPPNGRRKNIEKLDDNIQTQIMQSLLYAYKEDL